MGRGCEISLDCCTLPPTRMEPGGPGGAGVAAICPPTAVDVKYEADCGAEICTVASLPILLIDTDKCSSYSLAACATLVNVSLVSGSPSCTGIRAISSSRAASLRPMMLRDFRVWGPVGGLGTLPIIPPITPDLTPPSTPPGTPPTTPACAMDASRRTLIPPTAPTPGSTATAGEVAEAFGN